jgi:acetolactate synthase-1/2/3 large subunit
VSNFSIKKTKLLDTPRRFFIKSSNQNVMSTKKTKAAKPPRTQEKEAQLSGAEIVIESLKKEGVDVAFGYPGGSIIPVFDTLYGQKDIKLILPRHEQAGGHEAEGYARATGKVGVVITTGGPGATNLTTVLADAYMDSTPLVAISGQVKTFLIGTDAFQEADMMGISHGITKHNYLVKDVREIAHTIKEAFHIAATGRPGPVHISIPVDVQNDRAKFDYPETLKMRNYNPTYKGHKTQIAKACEYISESKRPIVLVGGGAYMAGAEKEVRDFIEKTEIPVTSTLMALGVVPTKTKEYLGMLGMHGTVTANKAMGEADLIINVGARFDDRVTGNTKTFANQAKVIHIDIDPSSIGKNVDTHLPIVGDAKRILNELIPNVKKPTIDPWRQKLTEMKEGHPIHYDKSPDAIGPEVLFKELNQATKDIDTIFTTEVGQHQMWAAQMLELEEPRQFITSGGLGTMGYGFPAAIGAQIAKPEATVVCIAGDGSFQMNGQELALINAHHLPLKIIIINNGYLGMVRQWQELFHDKHYSATSLMHDTNCPPDCDGKLCRAYTPDFVKLAEAYSVPGYRATSETDLQTIFSEVFSKHNDKPALIEVLIPKEVNVMPMVPPGGSLSDVIEDDPNAKDKK